MPSVCRLLRGERKYLGLEPAAQRPTFLAKSAGSKSVFDLGQLAAKQNTRRLKGYYILVCKVCFHINPQSLVESFSSFPRGLHFASLRAVKGVYDFFFSIMVITTVGLVSVKEFLIEYIVLIHHFKGLGGTHHGQPLKWKFSFLKKKKF